MKLVPVYLLIHILCFLVMSEVSVGIDLGTTNSCAYFYRDGRYECVSFQNGSRLFPSFVRFSHDRIDTGNNGKLYFGRPNVVRNVKRLIGRYYDSKEVKKAANYCGVPVVNKNNKPFLHISNPDRDYSPSEISAEILKSIKGRIEEKCESTIGNVIVTIPANFNNNQRQATRDAISLAGFDMSRVKLLNEPTAAAICYGFAKDSSKRTILVYDLGGGTFDVSILQTDNGEFKVLAHDGDNFLGGSNFDERILNWLIKEFEEKWSIDLIPEDLPLEIENQTRCGLLRLCEEAKEQLSAMEESDIEPPIYIDDGYSVTLTRDILNKLIESDIDRSMEIVKKAISEANLTRDDIDRVVFVGGSSRLLLVQQKLSDYFGREKAAFSINPDECVAHGACMALVNHIALEEKTRFSLGSSLVNERVECIIPTQHPIPCSETVILTTAEDYSTSIYAEVCQGVSTEVEQVVPLAETTVLKGYRYTGFQSKPKGEVHFLTTYAYDGESKVHITVVEQETGKLLFDQDLSW